MNKSNANFDSDETNEMVGKLGQYRDSLSSNLALCGMKIYGGTNYGLNKSRANQDGTYEMIGKLGQYRDSLSSNLVLHKGNENDDTYHGTNKSNPTFDTAKNCELMRKLSQNKDLFSSNLAFHLHNKYNSNVHQSKNSESFDSGENYNELGTAIGDDDSLFVPFPTDPDDETQKSALPSTAKHEDHSSKKGILKTAKKQEQRHVCHTILSPLAAENYQRANSANTNKEVAFSRKKRVIVIPSLCPLRSEIWWTREDYSTFRRIALSLATSSLADDAESLLTERNNSEFSPSTSPTSNSDAVENTSNEKWWCKVGHSRRGLEHLCCEKEGNIRQEKARKAILAVLQEQESKYQEGKAIDTDSLGRISCRHTKWARDLALATGLADAKAVVTDFDEKKKMHRDDYIGTARIVSASGTLIGSVMASFMSTEQREFLKTISSKSL